MRTSVPWVLALWLMLLSGYVKKTWEAVNSKELVPAVCFFCLPGESLCIQLRDWQPHTLVWELDVTLVCLHLFWPSLEQCLPNSSMYYNHLGHLLSMQFLGTHPGPTESVGNLEISQVS